MLAPPSWGLISSDLKRRFCFLIVCPWAITVAVASAATTNWTGLFENWGWREKRKEKQQNKGAFILLFLTFRRSLSHLARQTLRASLITLSVCKNVHFWFVCLFFCFALSPGLEISETKNDKITDGSVALRILVFFPNLPATIYFSEFSNTRSYIPSTFYSRIQWKKVFTPSYLTLEPQWTFLQSCKTSAEMPKKNLLGCIRKMWWLDFIASIYSCDFCFHVWSFTCYHWNFCTGSRGTALALSRGVFFPQFLIVPLRYNCNV